MLTINENQFFTVLVEFEVEPSQQQTFIEAIAARVEQLFKSFVGFVSASFHASKNGKRVVLYAQWHSKEDWQNSFQAPNHNEVQTAIDEVISHYGAKTLKVDTFRFIRVIENL